MPALGQLGSLVSRGVRKGARTVLGPIIAQRDIWGLGDGGRLSLVAEALSESVAGRCPAEERDWVRRIEAVRARMLASDEPISEIDYGAGSAGDNRTPEQMERGVPVTRTLSQVCRGSKSRQWGLLLFKLIRKLQPDDCLELGTNVGISAAYQAAALALNGKGRLITLEGGASKEPIIRKNLEELRLGDRCEVVIGRFQDRLPGVLERTPQLGFAFIDGHHEETATKTYFRQIKPHLSDGAVVLFDDIAWSPGMQRAWAAIEDDPHVAASIDLGWVGLCLVSKSESPERKRSKVRLPYG